MWFYQNMAEHRIMESTPYESLGLQVSDAKDLDEFVPSPPIYSM